MQITHHLKDGTVLSDIKGHIVKMKDATRAYDIMRGMKKEKQNVCRVLD